MQKIKHFLKHKLLIVNELLSMTVLVPATVYAADAPSSTKNAVCEGVGIATGSGNCDDGGVTVMSVVRNIVQFFIILIGAIAVIMIIVGGFKYITSGGDSNKTSSAKNTLLYAAIGIVVVLFAQGLVSFVLKQATEDTPVNNTPPAAQP